MLGKSFSLFLHGMVLVIVELLPTPRDTGHVSSDQVYVYLAHLQLFRSSVTVSCVPEASDGIAIAMPLG